MLTSIVSILINNITHLYNTINNIVISLYNKFYLTFRVLFVWFFSTKNRNNNVILFYEIEKFFFKNKLFVLVDVCFFTIFSFFFQKKNNTIQQNNFKLKTTNNNKFYTFNNNQGILSKTQLFFFGLKSVWDHLKFWFLPLVVSLLFIYYSFFLRTLPFTKVFFGYLLLANMFYLFISGFVFFFKKYQYRLYTSAIQRFWRRSLMVFWLIEGSLFTVFIYLIFNASQEPVYMYDNLQVYKTHLFSWRVFLTKIILSALLIVLCYILLLSLKWNTFSKTNNIVLFITVIILYISWLEFYQLFHLLNSYGTANWVYDFSEHLWTLELEFKKTRIVNHYVTIGLIAKFWHVMFAVIFWLFFIFRCIESSRNRYPLLVANLQNFLIIYIMSWLYMYPWFKGVLRKSMDMPYYWFFINNRKLASFIFFNDIKLFYFGVLDYIFNTRFNFFFKKTSFFYWYDSSNYLCNTQFRKHSIRDLFLKNIKN